MAAPSYNTDLQTVNLCEAVTGFVELSGHTTGGAPAVDNEAYIQGSGCISQATAQAVGTTAGMQFDYGSNISWTTGFVFLVWQLFAAPNNIAAWASGGMRFGVGSSAGNMKFWNALGKDLSPYPSGGWQNTAIDPTQAADAQDGSPVAGSYRIFGSLPNLLAAISKGYPHVMDAIRYGRGQIYATLGDLANGYATFAGLALANDAGSARWGLLSNRSGTFFWKGLLSLGLAGTAVDFRDSNKAIALEDTPRVYATFNKIEIRNAASRVDWTSVTITAPALSITGSAPVSQGDLQVVDNADVNIDGCVFTNMGSFIFLSNSTILGTTFRRCGQITQNSAVFDGCLITNSDAAVALRSNNPQLISDCEFVSGGTGHAIEITTPGTYAFAGNTFSGYGTAGTTNAAIYNNSGGAVTLNISGGDTPTVRNGSGASTTVNNTINLTLTGVVDGSEVRIMAAGTETELFGIESKETGVNPVYSYQSTQAVDIVVHHVEYNYWRMAGYQLPATDGSLPVSQIFDRNYRNP